MNHEQSLNPTHHTAISTHQLDDAAREHVDNGRRDNTRRAYASDRTRWRTYCDEFGIPETAVTVGTTVGFVEWLAAREYSPATITRTVTGARLSLRADGIPELSARDWSTVVERIRQYRRQLGESGQQRGRGQAPPVTVADIRRMSLALPDTLAGHRDRAVLLLGFGMAARRSELSGLWADDVHTSDDGITITLRTTKTSDRDTTIAVPWGSAEVTCPVRAWLAYQAHTEHHIRKPLDGRAFRGVSRHHNPTISTGITPQTVNNIVQRAAKRAGLNKALSAHSLRAGLATEARRAGHDVRTIAHQGRWNPEGGSIYGYMRVVDQWSDNAVKGIGL